MRSEPLHLGAVSLRSVVFVLFPRSPSECGGCLVSYGAMNIALPGCTYTLFLHWEGHFD